MGIGFAPFGFYKKDSNKGGGYDFRSYTGARPPSPTYLRPVEEQLYNILMSRSRGEDVGFDPKRRELLTGLVKSELGKREEDELRSAQDRLASSGLSGNPRAYEALAGRVKRDTSRTLGDELAKISIEDLTRANEERDINTGRLQGFNDFNFGQANKVADFDLGVYGAEEGNRMSAAGFNSAQALAEKQSRNELFSDLGSIGLSAASLAMGNPYAALYAGQARQSGKGIGPSEMNLQTPSFYKPTLRQRTGGGYINNIR